MLNARQRKHGRSRQVGGHRYSLLGQRGAGVGGDRDGAGGVRRRAAAVHGRRQGGRRADPAERGRGGGLSAEGSEQVDGVGCGCVEVASGLAEHGGAGERRLVEERCHVEGLHRARAQ